MNFRRQWEGAEWQSYSLMLAQARHGAANVQQVPDKVRGDCGIEFFSLDGCRPTGGSAAVREAACDAQASW